MKPMVEAVAANAPDTPAVAWPLVCLSLAALLSSLGTSIANVGLPTLAHAFGASFAEVQWVVLAYLLAVTSLVLGAGRLGDLLGRRRVLLAGVALFTAASVLCGFASNLGLLIAARALQGAGAAVMMALTLALIGASVPKEKTGSAMGLLGTMSAVGTALGPSLGGVLISGFGWPALFLVNVPLGIVTLVLAARYLPADAAARAKDGNRFDAVGTAVLAVTLAAYSLAMTLGRGSFGSLNVALLIVAASGGAVFIAQQRKSASPLIRLATLRSAALRAALLMSVLVMTVLMATLVVGPFYLAQGLGLAPAAVGLVMSAGPVVTALAGVPAGRLADRIGPARVLRGGLVAGALGSLGLAVLPGYSGAVGYLGALVLLTGGYGVFQAANNTGVMSGIRPEERGVVSGALNLARNLGLVSGASLMAFLFALGTGGSNATAASPAALTAGLQITFGAGTALMLAALALAFATRAAQR